MTAYLQKAYTLEQQIFARLLALRTESLSLVEPSWLVEVERSHDALIKHLDLIERRVVKGETIPHAEKDFSRVEPQT